MITFEFCVWLFLMAAFLLTARFLLVERRLWFHRPRLSHEQVAAILARITYKPGWAFSCRPVPGGTAVRMAFQAPNAYGAGTVTVMGDYVIETVQCTDEPTIVTIISRRRVLS